MYHCKTKWFSRKVSFDPENVHKVYDKTEDNSDDPHPQG